MLLAGGVALLFAPRAFAVTDRRVILIGRGGAVKWSLPLEEIANASARRSFGGSSVTSIGLSLLNNSLANQNENTSAAYWTGAYAIALTTVEGKKYTLPAIKVSQTGPLLARCVTDPAAVAAAPAVAFER
jgi:hypothetical protein